MAKDQQFLDIAFVVPSSGPSGIYGPSCAASGSMAACEINDTGGILGREVRLHPVDGGRSPSVVASEVAGLVQSGAVQAVSGWHTSAVRKQIIPGLQGRVPYVYTAVYEGGERSPGVFLTGETPANQVLPAMRWMARELGVADWAIVGNDYVWPRASARVVRNHVAEVGGRIKDEIYVDLDTDDFGQVLRRIERARVQGVLMFLLGSDAVRFNRAFTQMRLHERCVRLSPLMDENMLLATGAANTHELYSAAGYFESLGTSYGLEFERRYLSRMGRSAPPLTSPGESCFEGIAMYAQLTGTARSLSVQNMSTVADSVAYEGPRGPVRIRNRHLVQRIYLARADGMEFDVLTELHSGR